MAKVMVLRPAVELALVMAWRSEPAPESLVLVTRKGLTTVTAVAKAEVLLAWEVAVAVTAWPAGTGTWRDTLMGAEPEASVLIVALPRKMCAWPCPAGSPGAEAKNSSVKA